jgi:hypothetical protein
MMEQLCQVTEGEPFSKIWYYGSGIVDEQIADEVRLSIMKFFPLAHIHVSSDLLGAAIAACDDQPGTVAILGTGSHAAVFDGRKIVRQANSLGYLLGDEGSGCDIGKIMVQGYFYKTIPQEIADFMHAIINPDRGHFLKQLHTSPAPNQFLAEFAKVAAAFSTHPWVVKAVWERFSLFIQYHILPLEPEGPIQVVGSVGTIFAGLFREVLEHHGLLAGEFIQDPARRLFEIHIENE